VEKGNTITKGLGQGLRIAEKTGELECWSDGEKRMAQRAKRNFSSRNMNVLNI
jgi:hypothetical protein